jgi:hypothetical protein
LASLEGGLAELHTLTGDLEREDRAEGVVVRARIPPRWPTGSPTLHETA